MYLSMEHQFSPNFEFLCTYTPSGISTISLLEILNNLNINQGIVMIHEKFPQLFSSGKYFQEQWYSVYENKE